MKDERFASTSRPHSTPSHPVRPARRHGGYGVMAQCLADLAAHQPGYLGAERESIG